MLKIGNFTEEMLLESRLRKTISESKEACGTPNVIVCKFLSSTPSVYPMCDVFQYTF